MIDSYILGLVDYAVKSGLIEKEDYAEITHLTKLHLEKIKEARSL